MRALTLLTLLLALGDTVATAQVPVQGPGPAELQRCLLNTMPETWAALKLSPDQLRRMGFVQEACGEECDAAGMKKPAGSISSANGETVMAEVRNILTEEQYAAWVATCTGGSVPPK